MPRYAAERVLLAPVEDVWAFVAEPYHLSDWWPGISGVEPDRRGVAAGARWKVLGPGYLRKPETPGVLLVHAVEPRRRFVFELLRDRAVVDLQLQPLDGKRTEAALAVAFPWWNIFNGTLPKRALTRLYDLVQTAAEL
ncbi:MAG: SRPBCC family protein [Gaiellaceae bacterium]